MLLKSSQRMVEKIFSHKVFKHIDIKAIANKYDVTSDIYAANAKLVPNAEAKLQVLNEISAIPPGGILITNPGTYTVSNDIVWSPTDSGAAITIQCNDVTLNLNGHSLAAHIPDIKKNTVGFKAQSAEKGQTLDSIKITNGTLKSMGLYGICAQKVSNFVVENITIDGIRYENLETANISPAGIHVDTANKVTITNCKVTNLEVTSSSCAGVQLLETKNGTVTDCIMSGFNNHDGSVQGFSYIGSTSIITTNCTSTNFQSSYKGITQTLGHTVIGYCPWFCSKLSFVSCKAINMTGCCDDCHGMSLFLVSDSTVTNFYASNVLDGSGTNTGAKTTGLEVYGIGITIEDCTVENIKAIKPQDLQSTGFSAWGALISFTNCTATDVQVLDENQNPNIAYGYGTGFGWAPDPRWEFRSIGALWVKYNGCKAIGCQVGFDTWYHIESKWEDNISAENCGIPILVQINGIRTLSGNKCSECPKPFSVTITNIARENNYPALE